ncbi:MAG: AAA family ATPase [Kiritimatiellae bacterium]|nr:AAA family ATPase [Kiritimatiellia bacterium]
MSEEKTMTAHDAEQIVLASMIAPETAKAANKAIKAAKFKPEEMFSDPDTRREYDILCHHGPTVFDGHLGGRPLAELATPYIEKYLAAIVADYRRRLAEADRTLDTFETPGPDSEDPDCLFQNRWLRRGACGAIVSTSGVGKSSFSMQAATVWAGGQECLGVRPLKPLKIGIFQSEDDEYDVANFRDRIRIGLAAELDWTPEQIKEAESRVIFCALDGSTGARFVEHLRRKQARHHFDLIVINPLFAFFGGDLNDGNAMTAFLRHGIDPLIKADDTKCGCIIIHHTGKPNRDAMNQGDIFKAYLGSGSGEFTNYIRSALVLTPWNGGKLSGVFDLIAAKHGDKLGWRDADGKPTTKKVVCYANRLPEYADDETKRGMIYWIEPDEAQFAELKKGAAAATQTAKANQPPPIERCAQIVAELIRTAWTAETRPANAKNGQRQWVSKGLNSKQAGGFSRSTREAAYNLITADPARFGLREIGNGRGAFFVATDAATATTENTDLNPEQEELF